MITLNIDNYILGNDEVVIFKQERVSASKFTPSFTNGLMLTNQNIILIRKNSFGIVKGFEVYPLSTLKMLGSVPQMFINTSFLSNSILDIYFTGSSISLTFTTKTEAVKWFNLISKIIKEDNVDESLIEAIPESGVDIIVKSIRNTLEVFKDKDPLPVIKSVASKCQFCGAPITGLQDKVVTCRYCDSEQKIKESGGINGNY